MTAAPSRSAIVTGGGSGIGAAIALRLANEGYRVAVNDLSGEACRKTVQAIAGAGGTALEAPGDVSNESDVSRIAEITGSRFGSIDLLVNNAGHVQQTAFSEISLSDFERMFAVHVRGAFLMMRAVLPSMLAARSGSIVNVTSQLGQIGGVGLAHYSAAKGAIIAMTKSAARELSAKGIRVNSVAPGPINTPLVEGLSSDWRREKAASLPLGRFGEPHEVAGAVAFLASEDGALFVGQTLGPNSGDVML